MSIRRSKQMSGSSPYIHLLVMDTCAVVTWVVVTSYVQFTNGDKILKYINKLNKLCNKSEVKHHKWNNLATKLVSAWNDK